MSVIEEEYTEYQFPVLPSKGLISRNVNPDDIPYTFGDVYQQDTYYPEKINKLGEPYILRDFRGITVLAQPFTYNPQAQTLRVYHRMVFAVTTVGMDDINVKVRKSYSYNKYFAELYGERFINFNQMRYDSVDEHGRMIVIAHDDFLTAIQPFVDWKNQKGIRCDLYSVSCSEIGGANKDSIKSFIQSEYDADNDLTFVQLVGDAAQVPTFFYDDGGSDPQYALLEGNDSYPEIFIGRFSAENTSHVTTQVDRTIHYERDIVGGEWFHKAFGIASNQGPGDDGEDDDEHMNNIRTDLLEYNYTLVDQIYDPNASASQVATAINNGRGFGNYCGHGSVTSWSTSGFNISNINALTNENMLPFIFDVACVNGDFTGSTCFAEAWLRASHNGNPTGAISIYASSINQDWSPPMAAQDEVTDLLTADQKNTFGGLCYNASCLMLDEYDSENMYKTWHIFGDASLQVRTDTPESMVISYLFTSDNCIVSTAVEDALVSLTLDSEILAAGYTDVTGNITLNFNVLDFIEENIVLTVTAYNKTTAVLEPEIQSVVLTNRNLVNQSNLEGTLAMENTETTEFEYPEILSIEETPLFIERGPVYRVTTTEPNLGTDDEYKHIKWNDPANYLMEVEHIFQINDPVEFTAYFETQSTVTIESPQPIEVQDPWFVRTDGTQTGEDWVETDGTYNVFLNQGDPNNPSSSDPIYSLRAPAFADNGDQTYSIFDKWVAKDADGEALLPYAIFYGNEQALETPVVFSAEVASVEAEYFEVTILEDEAELRFENGNYVVETPKLYATTDEIFEFHHWMGTGAEFENSTSNQTMVNFTEPNADVIAVSTPVVFDYHGLTIDSELTIPAGANYEMDSEFEFKITEGGRLTIAGTAENPVELVALSSGSLWSGIDVQSQDFNTLSINHTVISGADTAVNFHENATVDMHALMNITFINNDVAVKIKDSYMNYPNIANCIFDNNEVALDLDLDECNWAQGRPTEWLTIHHCLFNNNVNDIEDNDQTGFYVTDNLITDQDPLFVDQMNGDYHLQPNSPCIDAGDPNSPVDPDGTPTDIGAFFYLQNGNYLENNAGWNIVGLPREVEEDHSHYLEVFPGSIEGTCMGYDGNGYIPANNLSVGEGYWLRFIEEGTTIIVGAEISVITINMLEGWNLISGISEEVSLDQIIDDDDLIIPGSFYEFNAGFQPVTTMTPGKGYWVRANDTGTITITNTAQTSGEFANLMEDANYVKFTNNTGKEKKVYFGVEVPEEEQLSYTLPPLPPDEVMATNFLDARYSDQKKYTETSGNIELRNTDYPLTVEYGILNDNGEWEISSNAPKRIHGDEEYGDIGRVKLNRIGTIVVEHPIESFTIRKTSTNDLPTEFALKQNYPNPFNPKTVISYQLPVISNVQLTVYDLRGRVVNKLVSDRINAGTHHIVWNGTDTQGRPVSSGMYLYRLKSDGFVKTKKLVLLK